jgi:hypothetical protein
MSAQSTFMSGGSARHSSPRGGPTRSRPSEARVIGSIRNNSLIWATATAAASIGLVAGLLLARPGGGIATHSQGACIAMDVATAYGFLDETKRRIVTRALTQANNPYAARFPRRYRSLADICAEIDRNRWSNR